MDRRAIVLPLLLLALPGCAAPAAEPDPAPLPEPSPEPAPEPSPPPGPSEDPPAPAPPVIHATDQSAEDAWNEVLRARIEAFEGEIDVHEIVLGDDGLAVRERLEEADRALARFAASTTARRTLLPEDDVVLFELATGILAEELPLLREFHEFKASFDAYAARMREGTSRERTAAVYALEPALASAGSTALGLDAFAARVDALDAELSEEDASLAGVSSTRAAFARDYAELIRNTTRIVNDLSAELARLSPDYAALSTRLFPAEPRPPAPSDRLVPERLRLFFDSFDANADGRLAVSEASAFFDWVEANIPYRYDDENEAEPFPGAVVGDGRPGPDHTQTPAQTYDERAGDCEDVNGLEAAFYQHHGIPAFQAYVNTQTGQGVDHAIAIVRAGATEDEARAYLGYAAGYALDHGADWSIPDGFYVILDNAYSSDFGRISGGLDPGTFRIFEILQLDADFADRVD